MDYFLGTAAILCQSCQRRTASIHCLTENAIFCLSCDYFLHSHANIEGHVRNQLCDDCMNNSATISCSIHRTILCQPCYSLRYNCATYGHQIQILQQHVHAPQEQQQVNVPQQQHNYGGDQRREGMFEFSCNGDNSCERWMLAMNCEACLASNAVVYCAEHDQVLCSNCDLMIHYSDDVVPPHMRSVLCVTCKRVSRSFRIGGHLFNLPPPIPPAAPDEVSASVTTGPYLP